MKTDYAKIRAAVERLSEARDEFNRGAYQNIGVISGAIDLSEERSEVDDAIKELCGLVRKAVANNCRKIALMEALDGEHISTRLAEDLFFERDFERDSK